MQPRIYTYKITFEEVPYYYYGSKKERYYNQEYWGSPITNKWCWEIYTPKKQILEVFDYSDEGYEECIKVESRLIKPFLNDPLCLNENCGESVSLKIRKNNGKKQGKRNVENKIGIWSYDEETKIKICSSGGKVSGNLLYKTKKGLFGMSEECKKKCQINGGKKQGNINKKFKKGICGLTKEQRSENAKKQNQSKWKCLVTGHISTYNALSRFQNNRGIDKSMREMV
jgi:hypothetical protein